MSDFATLWTVVCQAPLSMGFSWQEFWSGLPFPPSGDLLDAGTEPASLKSSALTCGFLVLNFDFLFFLFLFNDFLFF